MLNLMTVQPGQKLRLKDGSVAEVVENFGDGIWLQMRRDTDAEELVHCEEVQGPADPTEAENA